MLTDAFKLSKLSLCVSYRKTFFLRIIGFKFCKRVWSTVFLDQINNRIHFVQGSNIKHTRDLIITTLTLQVFRKTDKVFEHMFNLFQLITILENNCQTECSLYQFSQNATEFLMLNF